MHRTTLLSLFLLAASTALAAPPTQYLLIGRTSSGDVWWHGHHIPGPYTIEVAFTVERDTTWGGMVVNRLPMKPPRPPAPPVDTLSESVQLWTRRTRLIEAALKVGPGKDSRSRVQSLAVLHSDPTLVDSATADSNGSIQIYWRGVTSPDWLTFSPPNDGPRMPPAGVTRATLLLASLEQACLILIGGGTVTVPPGRDIAFRAEIDSLRAGKRPERPVIKDAHFVQDLLHPRPIEALLRDGEE